MWYLTSHIPESIESEGWGLIQKWNRKNMSFEYLPSDVYSFNQNSIYCGIEWWKRVTNPLLTFTKLKNDRISERRANAKIHGLNRLSVLEDQRKCHCDGTLVSEGHSIMIGQNM